MSTVKIGQVWADKDKRRSRDVEILSLHKRGTGSVAKVRNLKTGAESEISVSRIASQFTLAWEKGNEPGAVRHLTREQWLTEAVKSITEGVLFKHTVPETRVSVGWPGGRGPKRNTIGQCWPGDAANDNVSQIFISPVLEDPIEVLETLAHEVIHAIIQKTGRSGHGADFGAIAREIGLEGKLTATHAGDELRAKLEKVAEDLGVYPHSAIKQSEKQKTQKTFMLKVVSRTEPDYFVRMTRTKIEEYGLPLDPWGEQMELEEN